MTNNPLYRMVPEEGKHPANSKKNPGAISGAALDNITNRPSGTIDFEPIYMTEEEYRREQRRAAFCRDLVIMIYDVAAPRVRYWWYTEGRPKLINETLPSIKNEVCEWWNRNVRKQNPQSLKTTKQRVIYHSVQDRMPAIALPSDLDEAYQNYTVNMSSEEAQKELFEAFVFYLMSMKKLQRLSHARIIDSNGNVINGDDVVRLMAKPAVLRGINHMLSSNHALWEEWQAAALSDTLGRKLVQNDHFIPIRRSELLSLTSAIKAEQ